MPKRLAPPFQEGNPDVMGCLLFDMQTFLPYPDFEQTARVLDYRRLGKQRLEAKQIYEIIRGKPSRWAHHPAVKMWKGYHNCLAHYYNAILAEWIRRGYKNTMLPMECSSPIGKPPWLGNEEFHRAHRSNLMRKNPTFYSGRFQEPPDLPYIWPV